jgi:hypothetical protein
MDPSRGRGWDVLLVAGALGVLAGCSPAHSQTEMSNAGSAGNTGKEYFIMSLATSGSSQGTSLSSPLPASSGLYQFESFYYTCQVSGSGPDYSFFPQLNVVAGPDKGMVFGLPVNAGAGGTMKFWLQPRDQVQFLAFGNVVITSVTCTIYLYGEVVYGTLQTLQ